MSDLDFWDGLPSSAPATFLPVWWCHFLCILLLRVFWCTCQVTSNTTARCLLLLLVLDWVQLIQVLPMYCMSTSVRLGKSLFVFHCHESLDVLAMYLSLPGESRLFLLPGVSQSTVWVPKSVWGSYTCLLLGNRFVAKCFRYTVKVPLVCLGKSF